MKTSTFEQLSQIDCSAHTEKKGNFTYLSWTWAWGILKKHCPDGTFKKHLFDNKPYMLDENGYAYVMVSVTVEGETSTEVLPVLDNRNNPIQNPTSFHINTSLQRALVKAIAYTGLGLYIYAGEDLPDAEQEPTTDEAITTAQSKVTTIKAITQAQAAQINRLIEETGSNSVAFLNFAGADSVDAIPRSKYEEVHDALLSKKEKTA
jgi:hypothetical protein|tara:strand:- start:750 stop:1367 length:618 start_codon:yes stop_codon:yes gene_type:complete